MLISAKILDDYRVEATDGAIGHVHTLLFDDERWVVRYIVVNTGKWLPGRQVLVTPGQVGEPEHNLRILPVELTREQVRNSPDIDTERSVSRQQELELHKYYQMAPYWDGIYGPFAGSFEPAEPVVGAEARHAEEAEREADQDHANPHLRSTREVIGYKIHASDGFIGHVDDFIVDTSEWVIRYVAADTRKRLMEKKFLLPPKWIKEIEWLQGEVVFDVSKETIRHSPEFNASEPVNREYEVRLYDYYGRPTYWI